MSAISPRRAWRTTTARALPGTRAPNALLATPSRPPAPPPATLGSLVPSVLPRDLAPAPAAPRLHRSTSELTSFIFHSFFIHLRFSIFYFASRLAPTGCAAVSPLRPACAVLRPRAPLQPISRPPFLLQILSGILVAAGLRICGPFCLIPSHPASPALPVPGGVCAALVQIRPVPATHLITTIIHRLFWPPANLGSPGSLPNSSPNVSAW